LRILTSINGSMNKQISPFPRLLRTARTLLRQ
jgi:hypothetical protein